MAIMQSGCKSNGGIGGGAGIGGIKVNFWCDSGCYNEWLQRENNHTEPSGPHSDDETEPYLFPFDGEITSLGYINKKTDSDTDIKLYKNGTLQATWQIRNKKWATKTDLAVISFLAGDKLSVYAEKFEGGSKPEDLLLDVYISFTSDVAQELGGTAL